MAQNNDFVDPMYRHTPRPQGGGHDYSQWQSSGGPGENPYGSNPYGPHGKHNQYGQYSQYSQPPHGKRPIPTWGWGIIVAVPVAIVAIVAIFFGPGGEPTAGAPTSTSSTASPTTSTSTTRTPSTTSTTNATRSTNSTTATSSSTTESSTVLTNESNYVSDPLVLVDLSIAYCFDLPFEHDYSDDNIFETCIDLAKQAIKQNEPTFDEIVDKNGEVELSDVEDVLGNPVDFMAEHGYKPVK